jgi:hypothetical protein
LNGDVVLTWIPPADPYNRFVQYEIFNGGTMIGVINTISTNTFTHIGADSQNGMQSYYIVTRSGCNSNLTSISDTLTTIFLNVNNPSNGTAQLTWNALTTPNITTASAYYIYLETPPGTWTLIDSVSYGTNFYIDTITVCSDSINYKIAVENDLGCTSFSSVDGAFFTDMIAPYVPEILSASVDTANGLATISWEPNASGDTQGYIILENQGGFWVIIDTVYGINNTVYTNFFSNASGGYESYSVSAFDSCWSGTPPTPNTSAAGLGHNTIYASTTLDICEQKIQLSWNPYVNWPAGVAIYEIYISENNGPFTLGGTTASTTFLFSNLTKLSTYCFVVKAISAADGTIISLSNKACRQIIQPTQPAYHYLQTATVENGIVEVRCFADLASNLQYLRIERADNAGGPFLPIGIAPMAASNPITYIDETAETNQQSYYYQVIAVDSCADDADISNPGRTILLSVIPDNILLLNTLQWNHYEDWDGIIVEYRIYRSINGVFDPAPIASVPSTQRFYEDNVSEFLQTTGEFCYYIEAVEGVNSFGISELSHSNIGCTSITPLVWVPNAFSIDGNNPVFRPVMGYVDFNNYVFRIFNRWGEIVYETTDINEGWDGKKGSKIYEEGVYVWQIQFSDGSGADYEKRGFVTLLHYSKQ